MFLLFHHNFDHQVSYPSGVVVSEGNELTPTQVKDIPYVSWEANPDQFYTLAMTGEYPRYKTV